MECHRCQHHDDVERGKYRGAPFEQTPCAGCVLVEDSRYTIEFDEGRASVVAAAPAEPAGDRRGWDVAAGGEEHLPVSVMQEAVAAILSLPPRVRDAVCWRYAGMKYREIALIEGITMAAVELRHRRALRKCPVLQALFREKLAKQKRRRVSRRRRQRGRRKPHRR